MFRTAFFTLVAALLMRLPSRLRRSLAVRNVLLGRPWRRLLTLRCFQSRLRRPLRLLPLFLNRRASLLSLGRRLLLGRCGRSANCVLVVVLPHYGVARLVAVVLAVQRLLLLDAGIPIP